MKVTIDLDATPQEMRVLLGLPDVESLQQEMVEKIRAKMLADIEAGKPAEFMRLFMPTPDQFKSLESMQSAFWDAVSGAMSPPDKKKD